MHKEEPKPIAGRLSKKAGKRLQMDINLLYMIVVHFLFHARCSISLGSRGRSAANHGRGGSIARPVFPHPHRRSVLCIRCTISCSNRERGAHLIRYFKHSTSLMGSCKQPCSCLCGDSSIWTRNADADKCEALRVFASMRHHNAALYPCRCEKNRVQRYQPQWLKYGRLPRRVGSRSASVSRWQTVHALSRAAIAHSLTRKRRQHCSQGDAAALLALQRTLYESRYPSGKSRSWVMELARFRAK